MRLLGSLGVGRFIQALDVQEEPPHVATAVGGREPRSDELSDQIEDGAAAGTEPRSTGRPVGGFDRWPDALKAVIPPVTCGKVTP